MATRDDILTTAYTEYNSAIPQMEKAGVSIATFANGALESEGLPRMSASETEDLKLRTHNTPKVSFNFGNDPSVLDFTARNKLNTASVNDFEKQRKKRWAAEERQVAAQIRAANLARWGVA